ncbi:MAG: BofC C-terminal domain-containing protein [Clostridia bacterium]
MKKYTIIIIIALVLGFLVGAYLYRINYSEKEEDSLKIAQKVEDECTDFAELESNGMLETVITNGQEEKVSPNCLLTLKIYYKTCGHLIEKSQNIEQNLINLTEEQLRERLPEWEIQKFTPDQIVLYKELDNFCNEHYKLKIENGYVRIYEVDEQNNEKLLKSTDISSEYLTEDDLEKLKDGVEIYTKKELNKTIEDFE